MQDKNTKKPKINSHILDLFVSQDFSEHMLFNGRDDHIGYNTDGLMNDAAVFISHLHKLDVDDLFQAWRSWGN